MRLAPTIRFLNSSSPAKALHRFAVYHVAGVPRSAAPHYKSLRLITHTAKRHAHTSVPRARWSPSRIGVASFAGAVGLGAAISFTLSPRIQLQAAVDHESMPAVAIGKDNSSELDERLAVKSKSASELLLNFMVLQMCTISPLVNIAPMAISLAEQLHVAAPVYWLIKNTFFAYFCGGETADDCISKMNALKAAGVGSILDLSMEVDEHDSDTGLTINWNDRAEQVKQHMHKCIETAAVLPNSFAAVKITALTDPQLLKKMSSIIASTRRAFEKATAETGASKISYPEFRKMLTHPARDETAIRSLFIAADADRDGKIDLIDLETAVTFANASVKNLLTDDVFSEKDVQDYKLLMERAREVAANAAKLNVSLMIDAEQTYFQPAIDHVAIHLSSEFNTIKGTQRPTVFTTYQMYLKDAYGRLVQDVHRAERNGYRFAAKLVRGAYMESERKRAKELGLADPICDGIEATHASYDKGVNLLLDRLEAWAAKQSKSPPPVTFMVASHNRNSTFRARDRLMSADKRLSEYVSFGQLLGMCDATSLQLARQGLLSYKYVPYGPVKDVVPYLVRRAAENSSALGEAKREKAIVLREIWYRARGAV